ncbi:MAG: tRNA threonylcarbamoyladenosine dehydratase [Oscillospiraceae bacterium]
MIDERFSRTAMLLGEDAVEKLSRARVAVFGCGGVGGYVIEALARAGIGTIEITDSDTISMSNINRQILALTSTVGMYKTEAAKSRILDINPSCTVIEHRVFFGADTLDQFDFGSYDYAVDAVDTVTSKLALIERCREEGVPVISSMGAGNKMDPSKFETADIYDTSVCPLARVMRQECRKRGIDRLKVVYSKEVPMKAAGEENAVNGRHIPGSTPFVPGAAGLLIASEVVKDLLDIKTLKK